MAQYIGPTFYKSGTNKTSSSWFTIRSVFKSKYFDLRVWRWLSKHWKWLLPFGLSLGSFLLGMVVYGNYKPFIVWFITAFAVVAIGGIDHIIVGMRLRLILRILWDDYKIEVSQQQLVETCRDLIK